MCESKELLVSFLYDELATGERQAFERHLAECVACREEVDGLRSTQRQLGRWSPPAPDLGFEIIRTPAAPLPASRPAWGGLWGLAAAAVLVLAAGAALAHIEVRYGADGLVLRTGWAQTPAAAVTTTAVQTPAPAALAPAAWAQQTEALERRIRDLEASLGAQAKAVPAQSDAEDRAVLRRVSALVAESEARQQRVMTTHLARLTQDIDARRKLDLALIDQGLMRVQSQSGAEIRQSRDLAQRMYRATAYQPK
ncbi:MAG: zf-HC2 domain-containing protein [Acidobacteriota bacterium]